MRPVFTTRSAITIRSLSLTGMGALSLLCTACTSHPVKRVIATLTAPSKPDEIKPGNFGASDAKRPSRNMQLSKTPGTAPDSHSEVASKTPDGGMSATVSLTPPRPQTGTPAPDGSDAPGSGMDKAGKDKDAAGDDSAGSELQPGGAKPIDGSDPSIGAPAVRKTAPNQDLI